MGEERVELLVGGTGGQVLHEEIVVLGGTSIFLGVTLVLALVLVDLKLLAAQLLAVHLL